MTSAQHIIRRNNIIIDNYKKINVCNHVWDVYASGYKCKVCDYYTGYENELLYLIKREKERTQKLKRILN